MGKAAAAVMASDWYDAAETMKFLNLAERTLRTWVSEGRIRTKLNPQNTRQRLYSAVDVDKLSKEGPPVKPRKRSEQRSESTRMTRSKVIPDPIAALQALGAEIDARMARLQQPAEKGLVEKLWLTLDEATAYSGLPRSAVADFAAEGRITAMKRGAWFIQRASLEAFAG